ncbi:MAG TPA: hypothetical protein DCM08_11260 [Microscillaceae bacterium]|jgi:hypothetical protein|nr:hypothetical protein [Microscillaceae bacterium]
MHILLALLFIWMPQGFASPASPVASGFRPVHDFHTSIAEMDYNPRSKAFEVSLRVFIDDFEKALTLLIFQEKFRSLLPERLAKIVVPTQTDEIKQYAEQIIKLDKISQDLYPLVQEYLAQRFIVKDANGQTAPLHFYGMEQGNETDVLWLYFEVDCRAVELAQATFSNRVLLELFDDQTNIVNLTYQGKKKSFLFQFGQDKFGMGL